MLLPLKSRTVLFVCLRFPMHPEQAITTSALLPPQVVQPCSFLAGLRLRDGKPEGLWQCTDRVPGHPPHPAHTATGVALQNRPANFCSVARFPHPIKFLFEKISLGSINSWAGRYSRNVLLQTAGN